MTTPSPATPDDVVLLDDRGRAVGTAPRTGVHGPATPFHLAFSCYLVVGDALLVTRRAPGKTFPGVWTNALCGHPRPGEALHDAVVRRGWDELGAEVTDVRLVLPGYRYRAEMLGVVEHEWCPVTVARLPAGTAVRPDPSEVSDHALVSWPELVERAGVDDGLSPWCREQVGLLAALGGGPESWPDGDTARLPPAALWR